MLDCANIDPAGSYERLLISALGHTQHFQREERWEQDSSGGGRVSRITLDDLETDGSDSLQLGMCQCPFRNSVAHH